MIRRSPLRALSAAVLLLSLLLPLAGCTKRSKPDDSPAPAQPQPLPPAAMTAATPAAPVKGGVLGPPAVQGGLQHPALNAVGVMPRGDLPGAVGTSADAPSASASK